MLIFGGVMFSMGSRILVRMLSQTESNGVVVWIISVQSDAVLVCFNAGIETRSEVKDDFASRNPHLGWNHVGVYVRHRDYLSLKMLGFVCCSLGCTCRP